MLALVKGVIRLFVRPAQYTLVLTLNGRVKDLGAHLNVKCLHFVVPSLLLGQMRSGREKNVVTSSMTVFFSWKATARSDRGIPLRRSRNHSYLSLSLLSISLFALPQSCLQK